MTALTPALGGDKAVYSFQDPMGRGIQTPIDSTTPVVPSVNPGVATAIFSTQQAAILAAPSMPGYVAQATNVGSPSLPSYTYTYTEGTPDQLARARLIYGINFGTLEEARRYEAAH